MTYPLHHNAMNTLLENQALASHPPMLIQRFTARATGKTYAMIDLFVKQTLQTQAPIAYWFMQRPHLRFLVKFFRISLNDKETKEGRVITLFAGKKRLARMLIAKYSHE